MIRSLALGSLCLVGLAGPVAAEVTPAPIFGDHMVLQGGVKAPVFGTTEPGGSVSVTASIVELEPESDVDTPEVDASLQYSEPVAVTVTADADGRWQTEIGPYDVGQKLKIEIFDADADPAEVTAASAAGKDSANFASFEDVLTGDVWLCSGQSNMEWALANTIDATREAKAVADDELRLFTVPKHSVREPQLSLKGKPGQREPSAGQWVKLSRKAVEPFSAVGYYFGKAIRNATGRPVGLIDSTWGGTPSEAWTRESTLKTLKTTAPLYKRWDKVDADFAEKGSTEETWSRDLSPTHPHHPGNLNNGMIVPLVPFALKGAIWYQGESNASRAEQYDEIFPAMIEDWRDQFGQKIPFYWVQLANYQQYQENPNAVSKWAELRESQDKTLDELENVGQAVILDIGEANDIHPRNKKDVGQRLALAALRGVYEIDRDGMLSPRFKEATMEGDTATITFDVDGDVLQVRRDESVGADGAAPNELLGFTVAGKDQTFYRARATVTAPNTVTVVAPEEVSEIASVRYGWADNPRVTLFNTRGIPAAPFRTDDWPGVTDGWY